MAPVLRINTFAGPAPFVVYGRVHGQMRSGGEMEGRDEGRFIGVRVPRDVLVRLRHQAERRGWTMSAYVREALAAAFESEDRASR